MRSSSSQPGWGRRRTSTSGPSSCPYPKDARVEVERELTYRRADGENLQMDVYRPEDRSPDAPLPAVVFVHGGPVAGLPGPPRDAAHFASYGRLVAASGLAAETFPHRHRRLTLFRLMDPEGRTLPNWRISEALEGTRSGSRRWTSGARCRSRWPTTPPSAVIVEHLEQVAPSG